MKTLLTLIALLISTSAYPADWNHFTSTAKQDRATKARCDKTKPDIVVEEVRDGDGDITTPRSVTPELCNNVEALAFAVGQFRDVLKNNVRRYEQERLTKAGIDRSYLRELAEDANFTHAQKCSRFAVAGLKARYETHVGVSCP